jgi:hypothetical protein
VCQRAKCGILDGGVPSSTEEAAVTKRPTEQPNRAALDAVRQQEIVEAVQTQPEELGTVRLYYWSSRTSPGTWFTVPIPWPGDEGERMLATFVFDDSPDVEEEPQPVQIVADDGMFLRVVSRAGDFTLAGNAALREAFAAVLEHLVDGGKIAVSDGAA